MFDKNNKINLEKSFEKNVEINLNNFHKKKKLKKSYETIYKIIKKNIKKNHNNLEIGSGFGYLKNYIKKLTTSDYPRNKFVDLEINAYAIDNKIKYDNIILIDVLHHFEHPKRALSQLSKILNKDGKLIIADVHLGILPKIIFKLFHHEPVNMKNQISLIEKKINKPDYFANQSYYQRIILNNEHEIRSKLYDLIKVYQWSDFRYICTGGFSNKQHLPDILLSFIHTIDKNIFDYFPNIFSVRGVAVLKKK